MSYAGLCAEQMVAIQRRVTEMGQGFDIYLHSLDMAYMSMMMMTKKKKKKKKKKENKKEKMKRKWKPY
jgi:hypothetical protein